MASDYALIIYIVSGIVSSAIILRFVLSSGRFGKGDLNKPQLLTLTSTKLFVNEWGKIFVIVKGKGKVSINLEGDVEWKDPGINEISGETTIEIPVKPKVGGDVPVKVIIDSPYGKEFSTISLKVEKKEVIVGLDEIIPLRNIPLKNLVSGYGCSSKPFKVNFLSPTVPKEFEGVWDCCLLGCGGWGCAYLCVRGDGSTNQS